MAHRLLQVLFEIVFKFVDRLVKSLVGSDEVTFFVLQTEILRLHVLELLELLVQVFCHKLQLPIARVYLVLESLHFWHNLISV